MSRRIRITICCVLVLLAFGAGALAYAHSYGDRLGNALAEPALETEFLVDKDGKIEVPAGGWTKDAKQNRGVDGNPFFILEIVPYEGMGKMGFFIAGQEPIDVDAAARDGLDIPGGTAFYDYTYGVSFKYWEDEAPTTDKWQGLTPTPLRQYGEMEYVGAGNGQYNRSNEVMVGGHVTSATYSEVEGGAYKWKPLTVEECLAIEANPTEKATYENAYQDVVNVGDTFKMFFSDTKYVSNSGNIVKHKNTFLKRSVGLMYDFDVNGKRIEVSETELNARLASYRTTVLSVTPEDLNLNPDLVRRADLIVFTPLSEFIASSGGTISINGIHTSVLSGETLRGGDGKVKSEYKYIPYLRKNKVGYEDPTGTYGRVKNVPGATYETNPLDWEIALLIYECATNPEGVCPIVTDYKTFNECQDDNTLEVAISKKFGNGTYGTGALKAGTQNNFVKLYLMMNQMKNPIFESFYGEVTSTDHAMFSSVPMVDSTGAVMKKKDNTDLTTGVFLYDKDWPVEKKGSDASRIYWNTKTLLPWQMLPNDTQHDSLSDYSAVMNAYEIMVEASPGTYNLTSNDAQNGIRNGILSFHGDNKMGTSFDNPSDPCLVKNNQYGAELYEYFDSIVQPEDYPVQEGDLTMADCLNYLLNYVNNTPFPNINTDQYKVLELQPSKDFESKTGFWTPYFATHLHTVNAPEVDQMTTAEFIGSHVECISDYDLIYIGMNKMSDDVTMDFTKFDYDTETDYDTNFVYAHTGPKVEIPDDFKAMYGWLGTNERDKEKYFAFSGNDLTNLALSKLLEYDKAGFPIMFGDGFFTSTSADVIVNKVDRNSNVYTIGNTAVNTLYQKAITENVGSERTRFRNLVALNGEKVKMVFASSADSPILYDSSKADALRYINGTNNANRTLYYKFTVDAPAGTIYQVKLYVDSNTDGVYTKTLEDVGSNVYATNAGGEEAGEIMSGIVEAGKTYVVKRTISDRIGSLSWKLALVREVSGVERTYAALSGVSAIKIGPSDTVQNIRVLQIMPSDESKCTLFLPTDLEIANGNVRPGTSQKFYEKVQNINGMNITFVRMKQDEILKYLNGYTTGGPDPVAIPANPEYLYDEYDMLVLGFSDCYDGVSDPVLITAIKKFIDDGKAVLYSHDTSSVIGSQSTVTFGSWGKTVTESFREIFGMDRYGAMKNIDPDSVIGTVDTPYIPTSGSSTAVYTNGLGKDLIQGVSNGLLFRSLYSELGYSSGADPNVNSTKVSRVNVGAITEYPYTIPKTIDVESTHPQYYQLDMEKSDIVVWYCLDGGTGGDAYENDFFGTTRNDVRNNYYIYNKGNVTYSGMGHKMNNSGEVMLTDREIELFVNTFVAAYRSTAKPVNVQVTNSDATANGLGEYSLCVEVDSADPDDVFGNDIEPDYHLQVPDGDGTGYDEGATNSVKSKRVYFRLIDTNSYGGTYDVSLVWNNGSTVNGIKIDGTGTMLAVYRADDGAFVDTETVKYTKEKIYYVDVPITLENANVGQVVGTTNLTVKVTMNYTVGERPFAVSSETDISIMPRGYFNLD